MFTHARDNTFVKYRFISESRFINKMCPFSVQNGKIRCRQKSVFVKVFRYNTYIRKIQKKGF